MNTPPPIPTPPALRWREFRIRVLPAVLFVAAIGSAGYLWKQNVTSPALVGAVEVRNARVNSPYAGKIASLNVERFQTVTQGTPVAVLVPSDPRAAMDVIQSELNILQAKLGPSLKQQRNETAYEQMQMNWLAQRVDLATALINHELAQSELVRTQELHDLKLVPDSLFDIASKTEQMWAADVLTRSNLVNDTSVRLKRLEILGAPQPADDPIRSMMAKVETEEQKLAAAAAGTEPVTLVAPMSGMVNVLVREPGENMAAGELLLTIAATNAEHIISYLRQPIPFEPKAGMKMSVRTRTPQIQTGVAEIEKVGSQFEGITNALAILRPGVPVDLGLPIQISLPPGIKVRPGELVDLSLLSQN